MEEPVLKKSRNFGGSKSQSKSKASSGPDDIDDDDNREYEHSFVTDHAVAQSGSDQEEDEEFDLKRHEQHMFVIGMQTSLCCFCHPGPVLCVSCHSLTIIASFIFS